MLNLNNIINSVVSSKVVQYGFKAVSFVTMLFKLYKAGMHMVELKTHSANAFRSLVKVVNVMS